MPPARSVVPAEGTMAFERWTPRQDYTKQEEYLLRRLRRTRKLFVFLRDHRQELFNDTFQAELESMYRDTGEGVESVPPASHAMIVLLQSYLGVSDAEVVELTVVDLRWQMVLDRLGATAESVRSSRRGREHRPRCRCGIRPAGVRSMSTTCQVHHGGLRQ
jgi:hypothetical protein